MAPRQAGVLALALGLAACSDADSSGWAELLARLAPPAVVLPAVSLPTPFAAGCDAASASGTLYPNAEVEPFVAVNPLNPSNLIAVWQQDRWSSGGAHGVLAAASFDSGETWAIRQAPFSRCSGGDALNGGDFARATDPWISFGPDGVAYWMALSFFVPQLPNAMVVSRSTDGGLTWEAPIKLIEDSDGPFNDKNTVTADPVTSGYAYAVWDRLDQAAGAGPAWFSRTTDGGQSWEPAKVIYDPGAGAQTLGNRVAVLPDGALVNLLTEIRYDTGDAFLEVVRSTDQGQNWSTPFYIADLLSVGAFDPQSGAPIRDGGILAQIAVGPTGMLYVAWQDSRFSGGQRDGIALALSADGGLSWSAPVQVNGVPQTQAFTPAIAVAPDGTIGIAYYDLRDDPATASLLTGYWLAISTDAASWGERRISPPFDLNFAPLAGGRFLGDYQGLDAAGGDFRMLFVTANADTANRTDVRFVRAPTVVAGPAKALPAHAAIAAPAVAMTPEWKARLAARIERSRHQFPDRDVPQFLRRR